MVRATKRSKVVLEVVVLSLIFGVSLVFVGDIVHQDNIAPKRPGCDNNFMLVKVPTWIGNNEEEEFVGVDPPDFISNQGSLVPNTALGWFSSSDYSEDELLPMVASKNLTLSYSSESSIEVELKRERTADAITILVRACIIWAFWGNACNAIHYCIGYFFQCTWSKIYTRHHGSHSFFFVLANDGMIAEARSFKLDQILSVILGGNEDTTEDKSSDFENFVNNRVWFKKRIIQQTTNAVSEQQPADDDDEECTNGED
ncbi:hypothetical protein LXL04_024211 [Taraxacum kok-saghyz]